VHACVYVQHKNVQRQNFKLQAFIRASEKQEYLSLVA